jgi:hypothetical protein
MQTKSTRTATLTASRAVQLARSWPRGDCASRLHIAASGSTPEVAGRITKEPKQKTKQRQSKEARSKQAASKQQKRRKPQKQLTAQMAAQGGEAKLPDKSPTQFCWN